MITRVSERHSWGTEKYIGEMIACSDGILVHRQPFPEWPQVRTGDAVFSSNLNPCLYYLPEYIADDFYEYKPGTVVTLEQL